MSKRIVSLLLTLALLAVAAPAAAAAPTVIGELYTTVLSAPFEGQKPDYSVAVKPVDGQTVAAVSAVAWVDVTGDAPLPLTPDSVFERGHIYELTLTIAPQNGFAFAVDDWGQPAAKVTFRQQYVERYATEVTLSGQMLVARYTFGPCEELQPLDRVVLSMSSPTPGWRADFDPYVFSRARLNIANDSDGFTDGIKWVDVTDGNTAVTPYAELVQGHDYRVYFDLVPDHGYAFARDEEGRLNVTVVTPFGEAKASGWRDGSDATQRVTCSFAVPDLQPTQPITQVAVSVTAPAIGEVVAYTGSVAADAPYYFVEVDWQYNDDPDDPDRWYVNYLPYDYRYRGEAAYQVEAVVLAKAGYTFGDLDAVAGTVNGKEAEVGYYQGSRGCQLVYAFARLTVPGMTGEERAAAGKKADEIDGLLYALPQEITAADRPAVEAARAAFDALTPYERSLTEREFRLLEAEAALAALPEDPAPTVVFGDINEDGAVNAADALQALQHSVKLITLEGDRITAADVSGDSQVNASDALLILQYSVKLIDAFPVETA